ncbi:MAG TPA: rRNA maturation RNase YbeY [Solirubrobacteraceae bacterium]|nr:rRNA maturation RNase YbeY [Solirubrobacteraceae bacterium]
MIEVEVFGRERLGERDLAPGLIERLCARAASAAGLDGGHVAIVFVEAGEIARLNATHRGRAGATDVLSFPIDGAEPLHGGPPRELGDVVICPEHTVDVAEAVVHGVLHLLGMDHEVDGGEMLARQDEILRWEGLVGGPSEELAEGCEGVDGG